MTITLVGELHQDLFFSFNYYTEFASILSNKLKEISQSHDVNNLTESKLNDIILNIIGNMPKKIGGKSWIGRGGNGNNSATLINKLQIPVQLMTTIGKGHEWMIPQLKEENIDVSKIFQVNHTGPISVIMEDPKITKIFVAPNLKEKMNFEEVSITENDFENSKIENLEAGKSININASIKTSEKAIPGDYVTKITAETPEAESQASFRISVKTPVLWGWMGILIILLAAGSSYYLFRKYGRR